MGDSTTIRVKPETADALHARKCRGETYNDVLQRELDFLNGGPTWPEYVDRYDEPVLEQLKAGETYGVKHITDLYLKHTSITNRDTAKERKYSILQTPLFDCERTGVFTYTGVSDE